MIQRSRDLAFVTDEDGNISINQGLICKCIQQHIAEVDNRLKKLKMIYDNNQKIYTPSTENKFYKGEKPLVNEAYDITTTLVGYICGEPVKYNYNDKSQYKTSLDKLIDHFDTTNESQHNTDLLTDMCIYGKAYELITFDDEDYDEGDNRPYLYILDPQSTFVVYDTTVKKKPMFGVYYLPITDKEGKLKKYNIMVYTESEILTYETQNDSLNVESLTLINREQHMFNGVPIIRYILNKNEFGAYERALGLIYALNDLMYNRITDKDNFVKQLLVLSDEDGNLPTDEQELKGLLELMKDSGIYIGKDAKFINQVLDETQMEVLSKSISNKIHKDCKVPDLTDEKFAGQSSGIALGFKMMGTEDIAVTIEANIKAGIRKRLKLISNALKNTSDRFELKDITLIMVRCIPEFSSKQEKLQELQATWEKLSYETVLSRFDPEINVKDEIERIKKMKEENSNIISQSYNNYDFPKKDNKRVKEFEEGVNVDGRESSSREQQSRDE